MKTLVVVAAVCLAVPAAVHAAPVCPDRVPAAITAVPAGSLKCQKTVAKEAAKFAKIKMKTLGKCYAEQTPGLCPTAKDTLKIEKTAVKAAEKVAKACGDDTVQGGLVSSYGGLSDESVITSCMLAQHHATADVLLGTFHGTPVTFSTNKGRATCVRELGKSGEKYVVDVLKISSKCLEKQMKLGTAGDLSPVCIGAWSGGAFTPPTDTKAAAALAKLGDKTAAKIAKQCTINPLLIESIFACPGASTVADLEACILCEGWNGAVDLAEQEYAEGGTFVPHGPGALQAAVAGAAPGTKLLLASGDYAEEVTITTHGLQLVGCGAASGDRPRILPPAGGGPHPNGILASNVDGLHFQSLEVFDWDENGILVTGANGVSFRDVVGDGNLNSTYAIFPVASDGVVVETCDVRRVTDAGIYVGQSTNIVVRYNRTEENVAGIEIENSAFASVHNNYTANNTGGLLVFKLPGPPVQLSNDHEVFNNVSLHNNTPNFGAPGSTVSLIPDGTGMFVISNDSTHFHHNVIQGNNSIGFALLDQLVINALVGAPVFDPTSPDQKVENNLISDNTISGNGAMKDTTPPNDTPLGGNTIFALAEDADHGNCFFANNNPGPNHFLTASDCP